MFFQNRSKPLFTPLIIRQYLLSLWAGLIHDLLNHFKEIQFRQIFIHSNGKWARQTTIHITRYMMMNSRLVIALWCAIWNHQWLVHHRNILVGNWPTIYVIVGVSNRVSHRPQMLEMALQLCYWHVVQIMDWCFLTDHTNRHAQRLHLLQVTHWFQVKCNYITHFQ